jgi:tRNA(Ile)-lysidine synthetase-like protein
MSDLNIINSKLLPNDKFAIAVSGGVDSIAAAHSLIHKRKYDGRIVIFHVNNNLLSCDQLAELAVKKFCNEFKIKLFVDYTKDKYTKGSKEEWARKQRFEGFGRLSIESGIKNVILCHHLNDAVSSHLFNVFRGKESHFPLPLKTDFSGYTVFRPFLLNTKQDFIYHANKYYLDNYIVPDTLNNDLSLSRNFINNAVVPLIHSKQHFNLEKIVKKKILEKCKYI